MFLCHFFNTFLYKKVVACFYLQFSHTLLCLFIAVKRWTSQRKLGYCLLDCD
ncbi:hypothetical protein Gotur_005536, partial [Gossypium turneri]